MFVLEAFQQHELTSELSILEKLNNQADIVIFTAYKHGHSVDFHYGTCGPWKKNVRSPDSKVIRHSTEFTHRIAASG